MEDFVSAPVFVEPRQNAPIQTESSGTQTNPIAVQDVGLDSSRGINQEQQTGEMLSKVPSTSLRAIDQDIVEVVLKTLADNINENDILKKLNVLHTANRITVFHTKRIDTLQNEELPIVDVECGSRGVIAVSYGKKYHESWCAHEARVVLWRRTISGQILLPCCPTVVRFGPQGSLFIAAQNGYIYCTLDSQIISQLQAHSLCITSMEWLPLELLVSSSLDGQICIHSWKGANLQLVKSLTLTVSDLPRRLRKSNTSEKPTGITSIACKNNFIFVGGETGSLWKVEYPKLSAKVLTTEPEGIEVINVQDHHLLILTPFSQVKVYNIDGVLLDAVEGTVGCMRCLSADLVLLSIDNQLSVYSVQRQKIIQQQELPNSTFAINNQSQLIAVGIEQKAIDIYQIVPEV